MNDRFDHLFRRESGRITATITRIFGPHRLALAEDVVQEAFCRALEVWPFRGVPDNPPAWLMTTARNCALDALRRERTAQSSAWQLDNSLQSEWTLGPALDELFAPQAVQDDLLRLMFSCCHPSLSENAQVALILHILCGFSVGEVADAFLSSHAAIEKRITRAKSLLSATHAVFDVSAAEDFAERLPSVLRALYLLFNEGYHGASPAAIRCELCDEAIRLTALLLAHPFGIIPATHALAALMALISARLPARTDASGELVALADQDRTKWDRARIAEGLRFLDLAAQGVEVSPYHVEAAIAAVHARAARAQDTDWRLIVSFYDLLMRIRPSPVVALNRAIAISQAEGPRRGLEELRAHVDAKSLPRYLFYSAALGEMELSLGKREDARVHFQSARDLARNDLERSFIDRRLRACETGGTGESL